MIFYPYSSFKLGSIWSYWELIFSWSLEWDHFTNHHMKESKVRVVDKFYLFPFRSKTSIFSAQNPVEWNLQFAKIFSSLSEVFILESKCRLWKTQKQRAVKGLAGHKRWWSPAFYKKRSTYSINITFKTTDAMKA